MTCSGFAVCRDTSIFLSAGSDMIRWSRVLLSHTLDAARSYGLLVVRGAGITEWPLVRGQFLLRTRFPAGREWRVGASPVELLPASPPNGLWAAPLYLYYRVSVWSHVWVPFRQCPALPVLAPSAAYLPSQTKRHGFADCRAVALARQAHLFGPFGCGPGTGSAPHALGTPGTRRRWPRPPHRLAHTEGCISTADNRRRRGGYPPPPPPPRDALEGKGRQRRPQQRSGRRLEEVAKAVEAGYSRLQMPLKLALGVRVTVAGHRLSALEGGGGGVTSPLSIASPPPPPPAVPWTLR